MPQQKQKRWIMEQNINWIQRELKVAADKLQREALKQMLAREQEKLKDLLTSR